jgi:ssDNA-binding Zn-finger/Zn-ribbon topoisomerase 1
MMTENIAEKDRLMAEACVRCPICRHARKKQKGPAYLFVRVIEGKLCPYCRAYEKVYGRKAHEPV